MTLVSGIRSGLRSGIRSGINPGAGALADQDSTSGIYVPSDAGQYTALGLTTPEEIWLCDEGSGNLVGEIGGATLTANGTPLYAQAVSGWARTGVRGNASTANQRFQGTGPNPNTNSVAVLLYVGNLVGDGSQRAIVVAGTATSDIGVTMMDSGTGEKFRYRSPAAISDTTGAYTGGGGAHAMLFVHDVTNSRARLYTDKEKLSPTFGLGSSGTAFGLGAVGGGTFAAATVLYMARFTGANAESLSTDATAKSFLQGLGWSIPWS